jgi:hypothetical protein
MAVRLLAAGVIEQDTDRVRSLGSSAIALSAGILTD